MESNITKEKVAIWGTGTIGKKTYYLLKNQFDVVCFYDNDEKKQNETLYGIPIKKWTIPNKYKIIIATVFWREIANQLLSEGLKFGKDFETYSKYKKWNDYYGLYYLTSENIRKSIKETLFSGKKIAVVYGNCQTEVIQNALRQHGAFSKDYVVVGIPRVQYWRFDKEKKVLEYLIYDDVFWKQVDLFIYQSVSKSNKFSELLSTDTILHKLRSDCKTVNIVNIYFDGYFPQITANENHILTDIDKEGLFLYGDKYVDSLIREGFSAEEIVDIISKDDFLSETEIKHRMKASLDELKFRESKVDVKISDYIEKHYKDDVLFYLPNHPCDSVIKVYINRILTFLGYEPEDISEGDMPFRIGTLRGFDVPVYPAVEKTLGLDKCVRRYYPNKHLWNELYLDFREFMRLYISSIC